MNNEIILSALDTQLATKRAELESYETSTSEPAFKAVTQEILETLRKNVSNLIPSITISAERLEIMKYGQRWASATIYLDHDWRSTFPDENKTMSAKMNWYGSSATTKEENVLNDVQIFGAVASKLSWIEYEFLNNWRPRLLEISKPVEEMKSEISKINSSIYNIESKIKQDGISSYKQIGFSCAITPALNIHRDWESEGTPSILKENDANIKLKTGRSKWEYSFPTSFKVIKTNKYKTTLEVIVNNRLIEYTVSAKSFDEFILGVWHWQTIGAKKHNDKITEKFNDQYITK